MAFDVEFRLKVSGDKEIQDKIDSIEESLRGVEKAAENAEKPLSDTAKSFDDVSKAASDVDKDLKDTSGALDDVAKAAGDVKSDLGEAEKAFDDVSKSAVDISSDLKDANSAFEDIAGSADSSVSSVDAVKTSFEGVSESAVQADENIRAATEGLEGVGTATESAAAGSDALATSLDNIAASAQEAETNISAAATGIDGIGTSIGEAQTALDGLGSAFDGAGTATTTFNDVLSSTGSQAQAASGGLTPLNTVMGQIGGTSQQASSGFQGLNSNMGTAIGFFGTAASAGLQVVSALNSIHGAQLKVETMTTKLSTAQEAVTKAQQKLNELYASGSASASDLAQAKLDLQQATERAATAAGRLDKAQTDLNLKYARFGTDVLPGVIQAVTSTVAVISQLDDKLQGVNWSAVAAGAGGVAAAIMTVVEAIELLNAQSIATEFFNADTLDERIKKMKEFRESIRDVPVIEQIQGPKIDEDIKNLEKLKKGYEDLGIPIPKVSENLSMYTQNTNQATGGTQTLGNQMQITEPQALSLAEGIGTVTSQQDLLEQSAQDTIGPLREQAQAQAEIKTSIEGGKGAIDGYIEGVQGQIEVSESLKVKMHEQNEEMVTTIEQTHELVGSAELHANTINQLEQAYADSLVSISSLTTELTDSQAIMTRHNTAVNEGKIQFLEWVKNSQDAATQAASFKAELEGMAQAFGGLPAHMEGTVEEYQAFIEANQQGGEAAEEFADMALESWRSLVSEAEPLFNDLKSAWEDIFSGETMNKAKDAIAEANAQIMENVRHNQEEMEKANQQIAENYHQQQQEMVDSSGEAAEKITGVYAGVAPKIKDVFEGVDWDAVAGAMTDPFVEAFNKLPPAISDTLDETERSMLVFQAKFAETAEMAGTAWATNLQANMGKGFDQAIAEANQAAADVLKPFIEQHPETAELFTPLFDAMQKTGPGAAQAVQEVLTEMSGMPGPVGEVATQMLQNYQTQFADQLPGVTKTGVEGAVQGLETSVKSAIDAMSMNMTTGFQGVIDAINNLINTGIKQDPGSVPDINVNTNPANDAIQLIGTSIQQLKDFLAQQQLSIIVDTQQAFTMIQGLETRISSMGGKSVTITVDIGPAGTAITQLQGQIDAVHGKEVAITVNIGPAGQAITQLQGQIDGVHGKDVAITVDIGAALAAIQQLQSAINSVQSSMAGMSAYGSQGYGGGGTGAYYNPGYVSPYGQYRGAYAYAAGFGPAIVDRPTRMLVAEAGPELVSVTPLDRKQPQTKTAAAGMGGQRYPFDPIYGNPPGGLYGGFGSMAEYDAYNASQRQQKDEALKGMKNAVQQGAAQGIQQGLGGMSMGGGVPAGWGHPQRYTWTGGAMGTNLGGGSSTIGPFPWPPGGGGMGRGLVSPPAQKKAYADLIASDVANKGQIYGTGQFHGWRYEHEYKAHLEKLVAEANKAGASAGNGFASSFNSGMSGGLGGGMMPWPPSGGGGGGGAASKPINIGQPGYPGVYAGNVPASYGKPLGQLINGIAATILPGQGPRGPPRQAQLGMHEFLKKDTLIQAHRNERVDISPPGRGRKEGAGSHISALEQRLEAMSRLLSKLASQQPVTNVSFEVDGRTLSRVASKNMGTTAYGDR